MACLGLILGQPLAAHAQEAESAVTLEQVGSYTTGLFDEGAAEIVTYDPATQRLFSVNAFQGSVDIIDMQDPTNLTLISTLDITEFGAGANSVAVLDGLVAVAVEAETHTDNGAIVFFDTDGNVLATVEAGALPDMVTFTPDGSKVLVANEGEPSDDYSVDPEGSITIIDVTGDIAALSQDQVIHAGFTQFNDAELDPAIRIYGPNATVAQDLEPEYIAVAPDSTMAWASLQENNALAVIDLEAGEVVDLLALGFKDHSRFLASLDTFEFDELPLLGVTAAGQEIALGGLSGLFFEGVSEETGNLVFLTHPDRGPNPDPVDLDGDGAAERPFALPDYQAQWVRFELNPETGSMQVLETIGLTRADGTPISGLPNLPGPAGFAYADETPVDLFGNPLEYDAYGGDMEGIVAAEDGTYWMVDEYRPAIYHFDANGVLIERYVPEGSNTEEIVTGVEALPAVYAQRRANRGFEAVAYDNGILYAFIQSPLDNPDTGNDGTSRNSTVARILAFDTATATTVGEYVYLLDGGPVDKIGDAVALGDGEFFVIERDSAIGPDAQKYIYWIDISAATNLQDLPGDLFALELQSELGLYKAGIIPVEKELFVDLVEIGYDAGDKPEGLALVGDALAVLNDNDFGLVGGFDPATGLLDDNPNYVPPILGLITFAANGLDVSDRDDAINIQPWPVYGMFQPDSLATYSADGETFILSANEGDARDYDTFTEEARVAELPLDWHAFPNAGELQLPENLGRLTVTNTLGDADGDGLYEELYALGGRSFSIWDASGALVFDSGSDFEEITAAVFPETFNSNGQIDSVDSRSDNKGPEPEAITTGVIDERAFAFIGLERTGGVVIYDITDPFASVFVGYQINRGAEMESVDPELSDSAPESVTFIPGDESPTGAPLLVVAYEVSGSIAVFEVVVGE